MTQNGAVTISERQTISLWSWEFELGSVGQTQGRRGKLEIEFIHIVNESISLVYKIKS